MTDHPTIPPTTSEPSGVPSATPSAVPSGVPTSVPSGVPTALPSSVPTVLPFGIHYCQDYVAFDMEQYYKPAMADLTNAESVSSVVCESVGQAGARGGVGHMLSARAEGRPPS